MRWRKDYLQSLQPRKKRIATQKHLQVDDIVVVMDDNLPQKLLENHLCRGNLSWCRWPGKEGSHQDWNLDENGRPAGQLTILCRPVQKLILLLPHKEREDRGIPTWEAILKNCTGLRWLNTVFTHALAYAIQHAHNYCIKTNMASIQRLFYLLNVCAIYTILLHKWIKCIDDFTFLLQRC